MPTLKKVLGIDVAMRELTSAERVYDLLEKVNAKLAEAVKDPDRNIKWLRMLGNVYNSLRNLTMVVRYPCTVSRRSYDGLVVGVNRVEELADRFLFRQVPRIVLMSATVNEYTAMLLGLPTSPMATEVLDYPSPFPLVNRPVYVVGRTKIDRNTNQRQTQRWLNTINTITRARRDRKGIIHTVSYNRQQALKDGFEFASDPGTFYPTSTGLVATMRTFKAAKAPAILVSPAVTTGYDFPYRECDFQIIGKVPFPDSRSNLWRERITQHRKFPFYQAWQTIIQAAGRGVRAPDDRCESFIVDWHFKWLHDGYGQFAPKWFLDAIQWPRHIPKPIKL
jgi:ATP-dependent DNA helicase DinG